jgi:hypothetical protein
MAQTAARRLSFSHRPSAARECFSRASPSREYPPLPRVLALSLIQRRLRLGWSPSPRRSRSPLLGGLLAPAVGVAELLLLLEFGSGLSGVPLADFRRRLLGRLRATPFPPPPLNGGPKSDRRSECSASARSILRAASAPRLVSTSSRRPRAGRPSPWRRPSEKDCCPLPNQSRLRQMWLPWGSCS